MGNNNDGNTGSVDRELGRVDSEYGSVNRSARGDRRNPNYRPPQMATQSGGLAARFGRGSNPGIGGSGEPEYLEGDFGQGAADQLRSRLLDMYGSAATPGINRSSMQGMGGGGSSYGGDVSFNNASLGDFGSARSGYEDFAKTGGVDGTALRNRATAQIPAFYDAYKSNAKRRMGQQGGYSPGFDAQMAEIGRQAGREGFNASRQVEGDIAEMTQQGRLAGLGGLTNLGGMETDLNRFNSSGQFGADEGNANRRQSASQFDQGIGLDWARFGEDNSRYDQGFAEDARRYGIGGIQGLYDTDNSNVGRNRDQYLGGIGARTGNAQNLINNRRNNTSRLGGALKFGANAGLGLIGMGGPRMPRVTGPWEAGGGG